MKFITKLIKSSIKSSIKSLITEELINDIKEDTITELNKDDRFKLQMHNYKIMEHKAKELSIYDVMRDYKFSSMSIDYDFITDVCTHKVQEKFKDVPSLYAYCQKDYNFIDEVIGIKELKMYIHYDYLGSSKCTGEYVFGISNTKTYGLETVPDLHNNLVKWIETHPELLI